MESEGAGNNEGVGLRERRDYEDEEDNERVPLRAGVGGGKRVLAL